MVRFEEAHARLFLNKFVCRKCKSVIRANNISVKARKISCRKCACKALRPKRKK